MPFTLWFFNNHDALILSFWTENRESLLDAVKSILAGNPFIYHKRLDDLNLEKYFTEIKDRNQPFSSLASANIFMVCFFFNQKIY